MGAPISQALQVARGVVFLQEEKQMMVRSISISFSLFIAIAIVTYSIITWGSSINLDPSSLPIKIVLIILTGIHAIFAMVLFGNILEYIGRDVTPLALFLVFIIELIYIYIVGLASNQELLSGSVVAVIIGLLYAIFAT